MLEVYLNVLCLFLALIGTGYTSTITRAVTDYQCGRSFTIDETTIFLYTGVDLSFPCEIELKRSDILDDICVSATRYDSNCAIDVEFHNGIVLGFPDGEVDCFTATPSDDHCTSMSSLHVVFDRTSRTARISGTTIELKVHIKKHEDDFGISIGIIVGVIVSVVIALGAVAGFVFIMYRRQRHRRAATGMMYNQGRTMVITQAQYPQGTGYPPQPMQQPYYPAGNQPSGFSQPMAGFVPPSQTYGAEFSAPPPAYSDLEKSPSAPPLSDNPDVQS